jgi:hypothetical protein
MSNQKVPLLERALKFAELSRHTDQSLSENV